MKKLYMPIGISGSGKSTYINKHFKPEIVVSPDKLRKKFTGDMSDHSQEGKVWSTVSSLLKQKLETYGEVVLDATNIDLRGRTQILKTFKRDEVERIAIVFELDPEEAKRRVKADLDSGKDRSVVPDEVIDKQQMKFKRGFKAIKQQFDNVIYADRQGDNMSKIKKEDIDKMRKMVSEEMKLLKEEDENEAMEKASYQAYQDMYLTPQSNWRVKKYTEMYDGDGKLYRGKIGEVHRIQTVEYDFMHTGEVVTECGDMTYSVNAEDFRESFEMVHDEEGLKVNNEGVLDHWVVKLRNKIDQQIHFYTTDNSTDVKMGKLLGTSVVDERDLAKIRYKNKDIYVPIENVVEFSKDGFVRETLIKEYTVVSGPGGKTYRKGDKFKVIKGYHDNPFSFTVDSYVHSQTGGSPGHTEIIPDGSIIEFDSEARNGNVWFIYDGKKGFLESGSLKNILEKGLLDPIANESIREEIKKLVMVKDYFGKNIKGSIERLEEAFLNENLIQGQTIDFTDEERDMLADTEGLDFDIKNGIAIGNRRTTYIEIAKRGPENFDTLFVQKQSGKRENAEGITFNDLLSWL